MLSKVPITLMKNKTNLKFGSNWNRVSNKDTIPCSQYITRSENWNIILFEQNVQICNIKHHEDGDK